MRVYEISKVIGNTNSIYFIKQNLAKKTFPRHTIMHGISGTGKSTMAEISALALKCGNTDNGQPCLKCRTCLENIKGMESYSGTGVNVKKLDLGSIHTYKDLEELKREVFGIKSDYVFILEELQSLSEDFQNSLLESLKEVGDDKYIIFCTTEYNKIITALKGRCTSFEFHNLSLKESEVLIKDYCAKAKIGMPSSDILSGIHYKYSGVPREMIKELELLISTEASPDMIRERLGDIKTTEMADLFQAGTQDYFRYMSYLDDLLGRYTLGDLIRNIKVFLVDANMYVVGGCKTTVPLPVRKVLDLTFTKRKLHKISIKMESINQYRHSVEDFRLVMSNIYAELKYSKDPSQMHRGEASKVSKQVATANQNKEKLTTSIRNTINKEVSSISSVGLKASLKNIRNKKAIEEYKMNGTNVPYDDIMKAASDLDSRVAPTDLDLSIVNDNRKETIYEGNTDTSNNVKIEETNYFGDDSDDIDEDSSQIF